jgi:hypothetical protein
MFTSLKYSIATICILSLFSACSESSTKKTSESLVVTKETACVYSYDDASLRVFWAGYKTEDKLKVIGQFKEQTTDRSLQKFSSLTELVNGTKFSINTLSSASGDEIRDLNLKEHFFNLFTDNFEINGSLDGFSEDTVTASLSILGFDQSVKLVHSLKNDILKMKGTLSIKDFGAVKAYNSIHLKCFDLHKGVTWDDVDVIIEVPLIKECK